MDIILALLLALLVLLAIVTVALITVWAIVVFVYLPLTGESNINWLIIYAIAQLGNKFTDIFPLAFTGVISAVTQVVSTIRSNLLTLFVLTILSGGAFVWLEYHDRIIFTYIQVRQCGLRPLTDALIMPLLNILRIIANLAIPVLNFWANVGGYLIYGGPVILFKCTEASLSISQLLDYIGIFLRTAFGDFSNWVGNQPLFNDFNIQHSIEAFVNIFIAAIPTLDCFCKALHFVWVYIETLIGLPSLSATLNFLWMTVINVFQFPFQFLADPNHTANFTRITQHSCATVISAGDFIEEVILLTSETLFGLITRESSLPAGVQQALSIRYVHIITHPVCGIFRLVNMTLIAAINVTEISAPNGTGVAFFQFGEFFDEFKLAARAIGDFFGLLSKDAQNVINGILFAIVDAVAFIVEWPIGNVFYEAFGGPLPASFGLFNQSTPTGPGLLNFWEFYFVDYWFKAIPLSPPIQVPFSNATIISPIKIGNYTYSSALNSFFTDLFRVTQSIGNLIGLFMVPLGQAIRHLLNAIIALFLFLANFISYSFCIVDGKKCPVMPTTASDVNIDLFFNESKFFAGAVGDLFRQFDNASCTNNTLDANKTILCLTGAIVERTIDVFILAIEQYFHFIQDLLTIPSGQKKLCLFEKQNVSQRTCVRIPDLTTAITELDDALCDFGYAIPALIPNLPIFNCPFAPETNVTRTCTRVQTCLGLEFCNILGFIPLILQIVNSFLLKIVSGTSFASFEDFLTFSVGLLVNQFASVLEQFAIFLDCSICSTIEGVPSTGCNSPIFDFIHPLANDIRQLAQILTRIFLNFIQLVVQLFVGLFSGNPITAIIDFVFGFIQNVFIGFEFAIVDFVAQLFDRIGLGFLGTFIKALYKGFCTVLEVVINSFIAILKVLSFGFFSRPYVEFCCSNGGCNPHGGGGKKRMEAPLVVNGVAMVNMDNWLQAVVLEPIWSPEDTCNASMMTYKDIPFTTIDRQQFGEIVFCFAKRIWPHKNDNQTVLPASTCDEMMIKEANRSFASFSIPDQGLLIECGLHRIITEGIRRQLNISWLPQDLTTNPLRKLFFIFGLMHGWLLNAQFFQDKVVPPDVLLSKRYQSFWSNMLLNTSLYQNLHTLEDVQAFRENLHLHQYFEANGASQYDATLYTVTGAWSIVGTLFNGIANMSDAFSTNTTDIEQYLAYNYTLQQSMHGALSSVLAMFSDTITIIRNLTTTWSDPANYKKRSEAYQVVSNAGYTLYTQSMRQLRLMAVEYKKTKVYESTHYYNQTCYVGDESCKEATQFREAYEASMRGEDQYQGATSLMYKLSTWWDRLDFTTYPIANPRYKDCRITEPEPLLYEREDGTVVNETYRERFWRYYALVKTGTRASQRRWTIMSDLYERTRDKVYTQVLKHIYRDDYTKLEHHILMKERYQRENRAKMGDGSMIQSTVCHDSQCRETYKITSLSYDEDHLITPNAINENEARRLNTLSILGSTDLSAMLLDVSPFFSVPCIKEISFPCSPPLECGGNATTTLCIQCLFLQALIDRVIAASDQFITYFEEGGHFSTSLTKAFHFFNYSLNPNARVVVGDSPQLQVALFPAKGNGFIDFVFQSARYIGDDTPNKTRFNDIIALANNELLTSGSDLSTDVKQSTLFTNQHEGTFNAIVFQVIAQLFEPVLQFFYDIMRFIVSARGEGSRILDFIAHRIFCDWLGGSNLNGSNKRFSIGETLAIFALVLIPINILTVSLFGFDILALFLANAMTMTFLSSFFLVVYADWAFLCSPALPVILPDDILYFLAYNLWPKCSWFWGFMMESLYTNENCYSCNGTNNNVLTHCVHKVGFLDFSYNVAFIFDVFFPDFIASLRSGIGRVIIDFGPIAVRFGHFAGINLDDPFLWARYQGCNWIVTLLPNFLIFTLLFVAATIIAIPIVGLIGSFFSWLYDLLFQLAIVNFLVANDIAEKLVPPAVLVDMTTNNDNDNNDNITPLSKKKLIEYNRKPNGFGLNRIVNFLSLARDNMLGDRKNK